MSHIKPSDKLDTNEVTADVPDCDGDFQSWFHKHLQEAVDLQADDKPFMAKRKFEHLIEKLQKLNVDDAKASIEEVKSHPSYLAMQKQVEEAQTLLKEFESADGWELVRSGSTSRTYYREEKEQGTHSFKVIGTVKAPLLNIVAILYEADLMHLWFPTMKASQEIKQVSRFRKVVHMETSAPFPVWNRDIVADAYGVDMLEENKILVFLRSIDEFPGLEIPEPESRIVRAVISHGGILVEPIDENSSRVGVMMNVDPKIQYVAYSIINWFTGKLLHWLLSSMESAACFHEMKDSHKLAPFKARLDEHPEVYAYIRNRLATLKDQPVSPSVLEASEKAE